MNVCRNLFVLLAIAAIAVFAETLPVNDLTPYDNTIADDSFWCTVDHPMRSVEAQTQVMSDGFDSKACSVACVTLDSFSSDKCGFIVIFH